jgi:hypothetical protein
MLCRDLTLFIKLILRFLRNQTTRGSFLLQKGREEANKSLSPRNHLNRRSAFESPWEAFLIKSD